MIKRATSYIWNNEHCKYETVKQLLENIRNKLKEMHVSNKLPINSCSHNYVVFRLFTTVFVFLHTATITQLTTYSCLWCQSHNMEHQKPTSKSNTMNVTKLNSALVIHKRSRQMTFHNVQYTFQVCSRCHPVICHGWWRACRQAWESSDGGDTHSLSPLLSVVYARYMTSPDTASCWVPGVTGTKPRNMKVRMSDSETERVKWATSQ